MGQEIFRTHFRKQDFDIYEIHLREETALLSRWFEEHLFPEEGRTGGYEVEAWLIDKDCRPAPINECFIERINDRLVVPELSTFNVELNTNPRSMQGSALSQMHQELDQTWTRCREVSAGFDADMLMIGILPTLTKEDLSLKNISNLTRYRALNEQILRQRKGYPIKLDISGRESLEVSQHDVMLEAAATSFQIHLKVSPAHAARFYNASMILSAPMVALAANSPFLFGCDLWDETRIPLFEQAVSVRSPRSKFTDRVTFGHGFVQDSLLECFEDNLARFPVLLPETMDDRPEQLSHLRLHNGTIWRWNRPLIGFSDDGTPHLRIEHRVAAAGPSTIDTIANAAFYFGLVYSLGMKNDPPENSLSFDQARTNFYAAARQGLNAHIDWISGKKVRVRELLLEVLIPLAHEGLVHQDFNQDDIEKYLGVITHRTKNWCNGTAWQRAWVEKYGHDMAALTAAYAEQQRTDMPVHEWNL